MVDLDIDIDIDIDIHIDKYIYIHVITLSSLNIIVIPLLLAIRYHCFHKINKKSHSPPGTCFAPFSGSGVESLRAGATVVFTESSWKRHCGGSVRKSCGNEP